MLQLMDLGTQLKVVLKDAAGNATIPNANESIDISASGAATAATVGIGDEQLRLVKEVIWCKRTLSTVHIFVAS
jgi:hypothetical protein